MPADKSYAFVSPRQNKTDRKIPSAISIAVVASPMPRQDDCFRTPRRSTRTPPLETSHSFTHCQATEYADFSTLHAAHRLSVWNFQRRLTRRAAEHMMN